MHSPGLLFCTVQLAEIAKLGRELSYERGAIIASEGEEAENLYILQQGMIGVRIQPPTGAESIMVTTIQRKGEIFGWSSLVKARRYSASGVCIDDSKVIVIKGADLMALLQKDPAERNGDDRYDVVRWQRINTGCYLNIKPFPESVLSIPDFRHLGS